MYWVYDDGGRYAAGHYDNINDCVCRAVAIAAELPYSTVYALINKFSVSGRQLITYRGKASAETGVSFKTVFRLMKFLGWQYRVTPFRKASTLPLGRLVCDCLGHLVAVIDGVAYDTFNSLRDGNRRVLGYFYKTY